MKAINKQNEKIEKVRLFFQRKSLRAAIVQTKTYVYKKNVIYDKNQILIYFFLWKTRVEASKVITNSLKTLNFLTTIPFWHLPLRKIISF